MADWFIWIWKNHIIKLYFKKVKKKKYKIKIIDGDTFRKKKRSKNLIKKVLSKIIYQL